MADPMPELTLNPETAYFVLLKAREYDAKVEPTDPDEGSNPSDDKAIDVLEFQADDAVDEELAATLDAMNEDELLDLIALSWVGRGDFSFAEWDEAREGARRIERDQVARYVMNHPTISDDLEEALSQLGHSIDEFLDSHQHAARAPEA